MSHCIAPHIDPAKSEDFNYFSHAMWVVGFVGQFTDKEAEKQTQQAAIEFMNSRDKERVLRYGQEGDG